MINEYIVRKTKSRSFPWEVCDVNGNSVRGVTRQSAINQFLAIYGTDEFNTNVDINNIDKLDINGGCQ